MWYTLKFKTTFHILGIVSRISVFLQANLCRSLFVVGELFQSVRVVDVSVGHALDVEPAEEPGAIRVRPVAHVQRLVHVHTGIPSVRLKIKPFNVNWIITDVICNVLCIELPNESTFKHIK